MTDETDEPVGNIFDKYFPTFAAVLLALYLALAAPTLLAWGFQGVLVIVLNGFILALAIGMQLEAIWKHPERYPEVMQYV